MAPPDQRNFRHNRRGGGGGNNNGHQQQRKRQFGSHHHRGNQVQEAQEFVDDMTIAQQAACAHISFTVMQDKTDADDDETEESNDESNDDEESASSEEPSEPSLPESSTVEGTSQPSTPPADQMDKDAPPESTEADPMEEENKPTEDDDDESDVDLTEALAQMDQGEDLDEVLETENKKSRRRRPGGAAANIDLSSARGLATANEIDPYDVTQREKSILTDVAHEREKDGDELDIDGTNNSISDVAKDLDIDKLQLAGHVKSHVVQDRVVVVESLHSVPPLDDGNMLVLKMSAGAPTAGSTTSSEFIPLGEIFDIFGPVLQPLYTVRLPLPPTPQKELPRKKKPAAKSDRQIKEPVSTPNDFKTRTYIDTPTDENVSSDSCVGSSKDRSTSDKGTDDAERSAVISKTGEEGTPLSAAAGVDPPSLNVNVVNNEMVDTPAMGSAAESEEKAQTITPQEPSSSEPKKASNDAAFPVLNGQTIAAEVAVTSETVALESTQKEMKHQDPWSDSGSCTLALRNNPCALVYYVKDGAAWIDTNVVIRQSGKGCDASNKFDEELPVEDIEYSDDEEELMAKQSAKQQRRQKGFDRQSHPDAASQMSSLPQGSRRPQSHDRIDVRTNQHQQGRQLAGNFNSGHVPNQRQHQHRGNMVPPFAQPLMGNHCQPHINTYYQHTMQTSYPTQQPMQGQYQAPNFQVACAPRQYQVGAINNFAPGPVSQPFPNQAYMMQAPATQQQPHGWNNHRQSHPHTSSYAAQSGMQHFPQIEDAADEEEDTVYYSYGAPGST
jgi:hypothetical protein